MTGYKLANNAQIVLVFIQFLHKLNQNQSRTLDHEKCIMVIGNLAMSPFLIPVHESTETNGGWFPKAK